jgi:phospholipase C
VNCADLTQPGVGVIQTYPNALTPSIPTKCKSRRVLRLYRHQLQQLRVHHPTVQRQKIDNELTDNNISWAYYGDQFDRYLNDPYELSPIDQYCNICNWAQYSTSITTNATVRTAHLNDTTDLYSAIASSTLPAASFVKPSGFVAGHPASSKLILFEGFVKKIVEAMQANKKLWANTAILITMGEGGGHMDTGYVQLLDFFGDGTRIPMIIASPFSTGGHVSHSYADHVSVLKFIQANRGLDPITPTGRDALPNPLTNANPYVPTNSPAISDLMDMFDFNK